MQDNNNQGKGGNDKQNPNQNPHRQNPTEPGKTGYDNKDPNKQREDKGDNHR